MKGLFRLQLKIKHADWTYILQNFVIYFVLIFAAILLFTGTGFYIYLIVVSVFFIIVTQFHIYRIQNRAREYDLFKIQCINTLVKLLPLRAPLPPMTSWAATPELATHLFRCIQQYKPKHIVELGSGVTTLISGYSLEKFGINGKIISFDHDERYARKTRDEINLHDLSDRIELRVAPLEMCTIDNQNWKWYSTNKLKFEKKIDLLLIDGPPVKTQKNARYPAIPILYEHLNDQAIIIMHDTDRDPESSSIKKWLFQFDDLKTENLYSEKGITVLKKGY